MRRGAACGAREAVDVPAQLQRAAYGAQQLAQGVHDRVALVGADLQQHVAVALRRIEVVDRERRHLDQLARALRGESVAFVEQRGAEGDRDGQHVGVVDRSEDSRVGRWVVDLEQRGRAAVGQFARAQAERRRASSSVIRSGASESSAANVACAGAGVRMPAWWGPSKGSRWASCAWETLHSCAAVGSVGTAVAASVFVAARTIAPAPPTPPAPSSDSRAS